MMTQADTNRLVVDGSRCDGRGICALIVPERISLDRWGYASLDTEPIHDSRTLARARRAVLACPAHALTLVGPDIAAVRIRPATRRRTRIAQLGPRIDARPSPLRANALNVGDS